MTFKIGDEVVCVDAVGFETGPIVVGNLYIVARVLEMFGYDPRPKVYRTGFCVELCGVKNPVRAFGNYYWADRFEIPKRRSTETGMSILRGLLKEDQLENV